MNRRDFLKTSAAVTAATAVLGTKAFAEVAEVDYTRSVHFMYPQLVNKGETFTTLSNALSLVSPHVTFLSPLFLNVKNARSQYQDILNYVNTNGIKFGVGVGYPAAGNILCDGDNGVNMPILQAYDAAGFQPYLRVDNLSGYYQHPGGEDDIKNFLTQAIAYGFENIMLNPWPYNPNGNQYMPITEANLLANIDSCFQNASYQDYTVIDADIQNILTQTANQPSTPQILINYESPGPQGTIAKMTFAQQVNTFNTTLNSINSYPASNHLHWAPPFTGSYDPLQQLGQGSNMWQYFMVPELESVTGSPSPVQGAVQLVSSASLALMSDGSYQALLTISNRGTGTAQNVILTGATLGGTTGSILSGAIGDIQPGASVIEVIAFPASAGSPGSPSIERCTGTYMGGSFGSSLRVTLPSNP